MEGRSCPRGSKSLRLTLSGSDRCGCLFLPVGCPDRWQTPTPRCSPICSVGRSEPISDGGARDDEPYCLESAASFLERRDGDAFDIEAALVIRLLHGPRRLIHGEQDIAVAVANDDVGRSPQLDSDRNIRARRDFDMLQPIGLSCAFDDRGRCKTLMSRRSAGRCRDTDEQKGHRTATSQDGGTRNELNAHEVPLFPTFPNKSVLGQKAPTRTSGGAGLGTAFRSSPSDIQCFMPLQ
jgi:hypothetical protein